ncbi:MAG: pyruvate kinase [Anaerolineae bacterium]|nr:pyruvate kinase [Anaerolineae bacterium]
MNYNIIATLGPASKNIKIWQQMFSFGVNAFRLNTSHLSLQDLNDWINRYLDFTQSMPESPVLVLDLQGSKWRLGEFSPVLLSEGQTVSLVLADSSQQADFLPVPHKDFFSAAAISNGELVLNDAKTRLKIESYSETLIKTRVIKGGILSSHKGITFSQCDARKEDLSEKDREIFETTRHLPFIHYAVSYVKDTIEMQRYRSIFGPDVYLISKLERQPAINEAVELAKYANELWVCRGDMGAELGIAEMARTVHDFSLNLSRFTIPVYLAGQVLEHMVDHASPTRSEMCFIYDSILNGYQGIVLSDEAAIGSYPLESCQAAAMFK